MKISLLLFGLISLFSIAVTTGNAQPPSWMWAKSAGGTSYDEATAVTTDISGNSYAAGSFRSTNITFGSTPSLSNAGLYDLFVVKYDANGTALWARSAGGSNSDAATAIAVDKGGFIYVAGYYASDSITFGNVVLTNNAGGKDDIFLVKYDPDGNVVWAKNFGAESDDYATSLAVDSSVNIYMGGGYFSSSITFGDSTLYNAGDSHDDFFLAKIDSGGNALVATGGGGTGREAIMSIAADGLGNIYAGGVFYSSTIKVDTISLVNDSSGFYDLFLVKYNSNGNAIWATSAGGTSNDFIYSIAADAAGNVSVAGTYDSPELFIGTHILSNMGLRNLFIARYDADGNVLWTQSAGGDWYDYANGVAVDNSGNTYVTGHFLSANITLGTTTLTKAGAVHTTGDLYLAKLDGSGNVLWAERGGGAGNEIMNAIALDNNGNIYIAGNYTGSFTLGSTLLTNADNTGYTYDLLVAKTNGGGVQAVREPPANYTVSLFPNPASSVITIRLPRFSDIEIYTSTGQLIKKIEANEPLMYLNISGLEAGIYSVRIASCDLVRVEKLVKE